MKRNLYTVEVLWRVLLRLKPVHPQGLNLLRA